MLTYTCRPFFPSEVCHEEGKEDPLDELCLKIQDQKLVSGYVSGQLNKSARRPASSAKALHRPRTTPASLANFFTEANPFQKPFGL